MIRRLSIITLIGFFLLPGWLAAFHGWRLDVTHLYDNKFVFSHKIFGYWQCEYVSVSHGMIDQLNVKLPELDREIVFHRKSKVDA